MQYCSASAVPGIITMFKTRQVELEVWNMEVSRLCQNRNSKFLSVFSTSMESVAYHIQRHPVSCFCSHWLMYENPILVQTWHCLEYTSLAKLKALSIRTSFFDPGVKFSKCSTVFSHDRVKRAGAGYFQAARNSNAGVHCYCYIQLESCNQRIRVNEFGFGFFQNDTKKIKYLDLSAVQGTKESELHAFAFFSLTSIQS
ncbi:hypothetical protein V6N13_085126 [Hibiscus sabdariffa]